MSYNLALMFPIHSAQQIRTYFTMVLCVHKPNLIKICCADMKKKLLEYVTMLHMPWQLSYPDM